MRKLVLRAGVSLVLGFAAVWAGLPQITEAQEVVEPTDEEPDGESGESVSGEAAAAAATSSEDSDADESSQAERIEGATGTFTESIPIEVPAFRGLEPSLALTYDSGRGNDFIGVGWRLAGLSVIERASPRRGAPRYDNPSTDVFLLDNEELVACTSGMISPSCTSAGTHVDYFATRVESYLRIKRNVSANTWEITSRNGTKLTYQPAGSFAGGDTSPLGAQFRWLLASVADTHGNTVLYNYTCPSLPTCLIDTIAYNGATITFHRETRPDVITYAAGVSGSVGTLDRRLKTIDVQVGGQRARVYALGYETGTSSSRSRLISVQQHGRDASVDGNGNVSGGTYLPPVTLAYSEGTSTFVREDWDESGVGAGIRKHVGDFNGDGRADLAYGSASCTIKVRLSVGNGFDPVDWTATNCTSVPEMRHAGDVNGDGLMDLISLGTSQAVVFLNTNGTGFERQVWSFSGGNPGWLTVDLNADGRTDLARSEVLFSAGACTIKVRVSTGTNFGAEESWPVPGCSAALANLKASDFNGDGRSDLYRQSYASGLVRTNLYLSTGSGFTYAYWEGGTGTAIANEEWRTADVNGDEKSDLVKLWPAGARVYLSTGNGFVEQNWASGLSNGAAPGYVAGDYNGDGREDIGFATATTTKVLLSTGTSFVTQTWATYASIPYKDGNIAADFTGDGKTDIGINLHEFQCVPIPGPPIHDCEWKDTKFRLRYVLVSQGSFPDLLTDITNSLGGATEVEYQPSSAWPRATPASPNAIPPFIVQTASSVTADDGRGTTSQTTYAYSGALWNAPERRFLGFATATAILPQLPGEPQPPKVETTFSQTLACAGSAAVVKQMDGGGAVLRQTDNTFADNSTALPYTCLNTETTSTVNVGGSSKSAKVTRTFDSFGNVTQATRHGDLAVGGDETTAEAVYQPNTAAYIVSLPARVRVHAGTSTAGAKLTENFVYYDGNTANWQTPPVKGDATRAQAWLNTTGGFVTSNATYDSYGNVASQSDPLGNTTTFIYDPTYHLFVTEARDPLYPTDSRHKTTATWDYVCGLPTETRDLNNLPTTTEYDALCRPRKVTTPSGAFACTNYLSLGNPTAQHVETQTVPPAPESTAACSATSFTAGANLWSRTYLDGFGRTYRSAAEGPGGTQTAIEALTSYNERGGVASATAPFYTGDPQYPTTWKYDALDRKIEKKHPDSNKLLQSFGLSTIANGFETSTVTDELLRPHTVHTDAFGRTIRTDRLLGVTTVSTRYQYDLLGRLTGLTDHAGNQWTYTYDSLGRRTAVSDPDLGNWSYIYDAAGRLTDQTDAKGQVTRLTYDALGRVLTKTAKYGTPQAATDTFAYDQARTGFYNVGRQTTASNAAATIVYNFDNEGRQVAQTYTVPGSTPGSFAFTAAFDTGGRVLSQGYPDGDSVGPIAYDAAGRLKAVPGLVTNVVYDARGNTTNVTRQNGASTLMTYVPERGWLDTLVTSSTAGSIQDLDYSRDALGRITGVASPIAGESWIYGYDDLDRLTSADNTSDNTLDQTFSFDLVGNMLTNSQVGTYSYPAPGSPRPHAVTGISGGPLGAQSFIYDANGSMTVQGTDTRTYDGQNRLVSATGGAFTTTFAYGPDGTRIKKAASGATTLYFGDDVEVIPGASPQYTKYLPGDAKRVGLSTTTWLHRDHRRSVRAITNAAGAIVDRANYRPFGEQLGFATAVESKGYIGERHDAETGLMYLHARYYDPVLARFVQADPMDPHLRGVGVNRYAYAGNSPTLFLDPSGLEYGDFAERTGQGAFGDGPTAHNGCASCGSDRDRDPKTGQVMYGWQEIAGWFGSGPNLVVGGGATGELAVAGYNTPFQEDDPTAIQLASDEGWFDVLGTPLSNPVPIPDYASNPIFLSRPELVAPYDYDDLAYDFRPITVGDLAFGGLELGLTFTGMSVGRLFTRSAVPLTGQLHHAISRMIHKTLELHPNLRGLYTARDPRFVTQAKDLASHYGYDTFHRNLDAEIAGWVRSNPNATAQQFEGYLRGVYQRSDVVARFPRGL